MANEKSRSNSDLPHRDIVGLATATRSLTLTGHMKIEELRTELDGQTDVYVLDEPVILEPGHYAIDWDGESDPTFHRYPVN